MPLGVYHSNWRPLSLCGLGHCLLGNTELRQVNDRNQKSFNGCINRRKLPATFRTYCRPSLHFNINVEHAPYLPSWVASCYSVYIRYQHDVLVCIYTAYTTADTQRGGGARGCPLLGPENTIFSGFLPLNYAICNLEISFF